MFELAGYETLDLIGGGGFGEVWLAAQNSTGRNVAVKVAHAPILDETLQIRFEREYKALGRLSGHSNIVDIVTAGTLPDGRAYLVLEFIEGGTLWDRSQRERVEEDDLIDIGIELAKALKTAHNAGVLHRDVKPENVLLRYTGEAVLSDFGLAHLTDGATTSPKAVVASVAYAAPEILRGEGASTSTDIYGLGVCLLTAAIRSVPFVELHDKSIQTVIQRVISDPPQNISQLGYSDPFNTLVTGLMAKEASSRPVTSDEALQRFKELPQLRGDQDFSWSDLLGAPETVMEAANSVTAQIETIQVDEPENTTTNDLWWAPTTDSEADLTEVDMTPADGVQTNLSQANTVRGGELSKDNDEVSVSGSGRERKAITDSSAEGIDGANSQAEDTDSTDVQDSAREEIETPLAEEDPDDIDKLIFELTTSEQIRKHDVEATQRSQQGTEPVVDEPSIDHQTSKPPEDDESTHSMTEPVSDVDRDTEETTYDASSNSADLNSSTNKPADDVTQNVEPSPDQIFLADSSHEPNDTASYLSTIPVESFASEAFDKPVIRIVPHDGTITDTGVKPDGNPEANEHVADLRPNTSDDEALIEQQTDSAIPDSTMEMPAITIGQPGLSTPNPLITSLEAKPSVVERHSAQRVNPEYKNSAVNTGISHDLPNADTRFLDRLVDAETPPHHNQSHITDYEQADASDFPPTPLANPVEPLPEDTETKPFKRLLIGLVVLAGLSLLTGLILKAALPTESSELLPANQPSGEAAPIVLPLSIDAEGFASGTVEATTPSIGPSSPLFCQNALDTSGMTTWKGSQFFAPEDAGSIEQLVVGFGNNQSADNYISAIEDSLQCETWNQTLHGKGYAMMAAVAETPTPFGDRSAEFDVPARSADGSVLLGKTYVIRSGSNVTVIGVRARDQDSFAELTSVAEQAGVSFSKGVDS